MESSFFISFFNNNIEEYEIRSKAAACFPVADDTKRKLGQINKSANKFKELPFLNLL